VSTLATVAMMPKITIAIAAHRRVLTRRIDQLLQR